MNTNCCSYVYVVFFPEYFLSDLEITIRYAAFKFDIKKER